MTTNDYVMMQFHVSVTQVCARNVPFRFFFAFFLAEEVCFSKKENFLFFYYYSTNIRLPVRILECIEKRELIFGGKKKAVAHSKDSALPWLLTFWVYR